MLPGTWFLFYSVLYGLYGIFPFSPCIGLARIHLVLNQTEVGSVLFWTNQTTQLIWEFYHRISKPCQEQCKTWDQKVKSLQINAQDLNQKTNQEKLYSLHYISLHPPKTGLPNRLTGTYSNDTHMNFLMTFLPFHFIILYNCMYLLLLKGWQILCVSVLALTQSHLVVMYLCHQGKMFKKKITVGSYTMRNLMFKMERLFTLNRWPGLG